MIRASERMEQHGIPLPDDGAIELLIQRYKVICESYDLPPRPWIIAALKNVPAAKALQIPLWDSATFCSRTDSTGLCQLSEEDASPLANFLEELELPAVDMEGVGDGGPLPFKALLPLLRSAGCYLRTCRIENGVLAKDFCSELFRLGLSCRSLSLPSCSLHLCVHLSGPFPNLRSLHLDHNPISFLPERAFEGCPRLTSLSLCHSSVHNLWTTVAALRQVPSLTQLRFQHCRCHTDATSACPNCSHISPENAVGASETTKVVSPPTHHHPASTPLPPEGGREREEGLVERWENDVEALDGVEGRARGEEEEASLGLGELEEEVGREGPRNGWEAAVEEELGRIGGMGRRGGVGGMGVWEDPAANRAMEEYVTALLAQGEGVAAGGGGVGPWAVGVSPICRELHYRMVLVAQLPQLTVLDNRPVTGEERREMEDGFCRSFERRPYGRTHGQNIFQLLQRREGGVGRANCSSSSSGSRVQGVGGYRKDLLAARMGECVWPEMTPLRVLDEWSVDVHAKYRPRQFEYSRSHPELMVFGSIAGEVVVVNHETGALVGQVVSAGAPHSILGLCWLNRNPSRFIGGCDNGSIQLYDVNLMRQTTQKARVRARASMGIRPSNLNSPPQPPRHPAVFTYQDFDQLTSLHVNCEDQVFLASGYSNDVALYDLQSGRRIQTFPSLHLEHINVLKFAHHSPHLFATSSFDRELKVWDMRQQVCAGGAIYSVKSANPNVMVCFSPDDHLLLSSAVDNEVRQLLAGDGRVHSTLDLAPVGSTHNYTRSYYCNGRDYIVTGSCEEAVVRIACGATGRILRDVALQGKGSVGRSHRMAPYVQSLRGDPHKDFHCGVLVAYHYPAARAEIVKINLLAASEST